MFTFNGCISPSFLVVLLKISLKTITNFTALSFRLSFNEIWIVLPDYFNVKWVYHLSSDDLELLVFVWYLIFCSGWKKLYLNVGSLIARNQFISQKCLYLALHKFANKTYCLKWDLRKLKSDQVDWSPLCLW